MEQVPYNTGKVKIGLRYAPPKRPREMSKDELLLQKALLTKDSRRLSEASIAAIGAAVALGIAFVIVS